MPVSRSGLRALCWSCMPYRLKPDFKLVHMFAIVCLSFFLKKKKKRIVLSFSVGGKRWSVIAFKH